MNTLTAEKIIPPEPAIDQLAGELSGAALTEGTKDQHAAAEKIYSHTLEDGREMSGTLHDFMKSCPMAKLLGNISIEEAQPKVDALQRLAEKGRQKRLAENQNSTESRTKFEHKQKTKPRFGPGTHTKRSVETDETRVRIVNIPISSNPKAEDLTTVVRIEEPAKHLPASNLPDPEVEPAKTVDEIAANTHREGPIEDRAFVGEIPGLSPLHGVTVSEGNEKEAILTSLQAAEQLRTKIAEEIPIKLRVETSSEEPFVPKVDEAKATVPGTGLEDGPELAAALQQNETIQLSVEAAPLALADTVQIQSDSETTLDVAEEVLPELAGLQITYNEITAEEGTPARSHFDDQEPFDVEAEADEDFMETYLELVRLAEEHPALVSGADEAQEADSDIKELAPDARAVDRGLDIEPGTNFSEEPYLEVSNNENRFEAFVISQPKPEELPTIEAVKAGATEHTAEETLLQLAHYLTGHQEDSQDKDEEINHLLKEVYEAIPEPLRITDNSKESSPAVYITPELTQKLLGLLKSLGFQNPNKTLTEFVSRHDLEYLLHAIRYLVQLANDDNRQEVLRGKAAPQTKADEPILARIGRAIFNVIRVKLQLPELITAE
jgi:hypothetical protein